jgi:molybdate transport system substrate-binding protein
MWHVTLSKSSDMIAPMKKRLIVVAAIIFSVVSPQQANADNTLTVFAASSLTDSFTELGKRFEATHPGVTVRFSFGASSALVRQIKAGAPADLYASASISDALPGKYSKFVSNYVVVGTAKKSPLTDLSDLVKYKWLQCAHEVPCGMAADKAMDSEGLIFGTPVSYEPKVSSAVAKLLAGEVDAAIIYNSDVVSNSAKLSKIDFSDRKAATTLYTIQIVKKSRAATDFISLVKSVRSTKLFARKGFQVVK